MNDEEQTRQTDTAEGEPQTQEQAPTQAQDTADVYQDSQDTQVSEESMESAGQESAVYSNADDNDQAQIGDGTSGSGSAEHGGPISGRPEGESDPAGDSSVTKLDPTVGGNPSMGTDEPGTMPSSGTAPGNVLPGEDDVSDAGVMAEADDTGAEAELAEPGEDEQAAQATGVDDTPGSSQAEEPVVMGDTVSSARDDAEAQTAPTEDTAPSETGALDRDAEVERGERETQPRQAEEPPVRSAAIGQVAQNASMEDLMRASDHHFRPIKHGDVIEGIVMKVDRDEILIDIGGKTEGIIPSREATSMSAEEREALKEGDELLVAVMQSENNEGHVLLSLDRARQERAWRDLQRIHESGETIEAQIVGHNKGGLLVNIQGIRGFIPSSQVSSLPPGEANKQAEMSRMQNQTIPLKVIEINRNRNRLILSERQAMQEQRESMRTRLLQELEPGQIRPGTVTSVCDFGAFVDIGGADGLIHLSELSWKRVSHPREVLNVGDRVDVYVLSVDPNERKIALSLKRTQPEPWDTITQQYQIGQSVRGTITQITTFGAFARLEDGIEGLIHVSELAEGRVQHPRNVVKEGEVHDLKVIRIDPARKRIGLSLKRAQEEAAREAGGEPGSQIEADSTGETTSEGAEAPSRSQQYQQQVAGSRESQRTEGSQQRQPQQPRDRDRDRDRDRAPKSTTTTPIDMASEDAEDLPMGSMAHAFAALQRQRGSILTPGEEGAPAQAAGGEVAEEAEQTEQAEQQPAQAQQPEQVEQADPGEVIGSLSGLTAERDLDAVSEMGGTEFAPGTEGDATDIFPESDPNAGSEATGGEVQGAGPMIGEEEAAGEAEAEATDVATDSGDMPAEEATAEEAAPQDADTEEAVSTSDADADTDAADAADSGDASVASDEEPAPEDVTEPSDTDNMTDVATDSGISPVVESDAGDNEAKGEGESEAETASTMPAASEADEAAGSIEGMMDEYPMKSPDEGNRSDTSNMAGIGEMGDNGDKPDEDTTPASDDDLDTAGMSGGEGAPSEGEGEQDGKRKS